MKHITAWLARMRARLASLDLRARLLFLALLPVAIFACAWGGYVIYQRGSELYDQQRERTELLGRQMSAAADYGMFAQNRAAMENLCASVVREQGVLAAALLDVEGRLLAGLDGDAERMRALQDKFTHLTADATQSGQPAILMDDGQMLAYLHPVRTPELGIDDIPDLTTVKPAKIQGYSLVVVSTREIPVELLKFGVVVICLLATILISVGKLASRMSAQIDRHLRSLEEAALSIGRGDKRVRMPQSGVPAFDRLSGHIDVMARQLDQSRQQLEKRIVKATHKVREQRDKAEQANLAKSRFLAAASHDLRQPMQALSMMLAALRLEQRPAERAQLLTRAEAAAQAMSDLLNALLDISRLDSGGVNPHIETFALDTVFARLRDTYASLAERKRVALTLRPCKNLWTKSDPTMLERIVGNYISNAIRYTPADGQVLVAARRRGASLLIQVRDNGRGIDRAAHQRIFQEFVQLHNPQRSRSEGLGLGLAIVQRLARLLFHPISVRSCPGHGSTFAIEVPNCSPLPATPGMRKAASMVGAEASHTLSGCRVLLVEDDVLVRTSYLRLLELWGCEVSAHSDGASALAHGRGKHQCPHVIISDYRLDGVLDGIALVQSLRGAYGTTIPAVIVTGDTEDSRLNQPDLPGMQILFKPVRPLVLAQTLKEMISVAGDKEGAAANPKS